MEGRKNNMTIKKNRITRDDDGDEEEEEENVRREKDRPTPNYGVPVKMLLFYGISHLQQIFRSYPLLPCRRTQIRFVGKRLKWIHWCCLYFTTLSNTTTTKWVDTVHISAPSAAAAAFTIRYCVFISISLLCACVFFLWTVCFEMYSSIRSSAERPLHSSMVVLCCLHQTAENVICITLFCSVRVDDCRMRNIRISQTLALLFVDVLDACVSFLSVCMLYAYIVNELTTERIASATN